MARADGSDERMVAKGRDGRLSPDGRWLTYTDADDWQRTFLLDLDSGQTRELGLVRALAWSPDATKLAISNRRQLLLIDPDGSDSQELAKGKIWFASFSPEGDAIVYSNGNIPSNDEKLWSDLFVVRFGSDLVGHFRLTKDGISDHAVWGASWIAFSRGVVSEKYGPDYGPVYELNLIRPDGTGLHQLTIDDEIAGKGTDDFLRFGLVPVAFSSDGKRLLANVSMELGPTELVTFAVPEGLGGKLTDAEDEGAIWTADLSADGTKILFEDGGLDDEENHVIYTVPFDGGKRTVLIEHATQASWVRGIPPTRDDAG